MGAGAGFAITSSQERRACAGLLYLSEFLDKLFHFAGILDEVPRAVGVVWSVDDAGDLLAATSRLVLNYEVLCVSVESCNYAWDPTGKVASRGPGKCWSRVEFGQTALWKLSRPKTQDLRTN